ncbi:MAG: hypothetical protein AAFW74_05010 [Pseudomonadota bacterium]
MAGAWALALVITVVVAEMTAFLGFRLLGMPTVIATPPKSEKHPWGAWGVPNTNSRHAIGCFDVTYRFNSVGARDRERSLHGADRWVFLGDSFVEGFGIAEHQRLSSLLEEFTGREMLNFSSSGDFGPLQYKILYEQLASRHEHKGVVVGLLPSNDFTDNDPDWWNQHQSKRNWIRHRPYYELAPNGGSFSVRYGVHGTSAPRENFDLRPRLAAEGVVGRAVQGVKTGVQSTWKTLVQHSSLFSLIKLVKARLRAKQPPGKRKAAGYFTYDQKALRATELILADLARAANGKARIMLVFPRNTDFSRRASAGKQGSAEFAAFLTNVASAGWQVIDLSQVPALQAMPDTTLGCDGHWNAAANRAAAEYLRTRVDW